MSCAFPPSDGTGHNPSTKAPVLNNTYAVTSISTVAPTGVAATAQVPGQPGATPTKALLTLVTCWPADGHSKRVVVEATLTSTRGSEL
ncbi:sortase [Streptomyces sp. ET3-23]|uniref:sortase domain-containing protein n=1 Tax=Streptomyces sp. ET3-23 TaxID=2885643 RepID=UPI001D0F96E3|nr:sortase [Streptomyces sp. ET3-23]MCC2276176.1 sortase [Streptomyces sp. ET3-23]